VSEPIFVVGFQRSGTTLLQALLGAHPHIAAPPEVYFVHRVAQHAAYFGDLADDGNLDRALQETLDAPLLAEAGFDHDRVLARAQAGPRTYAGLLAALMDDFAERQGKTRWSEKTPGQSARAALQLFPDAAAAKAIHIVRDPRDVVASSLRTPWTDPDAAQIARAWREFTLDNIRAGFEAGPARFLQVRYEDLTRDPDAVLRTVCAFVGEDYEPAMWQQPERRTGTVTSFAAPWQQRALTAIEPVPEGRWQEQLGRGDRLRVHAQVGTLLAPLGYLAPTGRATRLAGPLLRALARPPRPAPPPATPEELYRRAREFTDAQTERV
jgi:hypothetical protein